MSNTVAAMNSPTCPICAGRRHRRDALVELVPSPEQSGELAEPTV